MVAVHIMTTVAQQETAKHAILKRLREADATSPAMPASIEIDNDEAQTALAELLAAGTVREARNGLYYAEESTSGTAGNGFGFAALLAMLVIVSVTASVIALAASR